MKVREGQTPVIARETEGETRRMVFRGVDSDVVRRYLQASDVGSHRAEEILQTFEAERAACIRRGGGVYIVVGIMMMSGAMIGNGFLVHLLGGKLWLLFGGLGFGSVIKGGATLLRPDDASVDRSSLMPNDPRFDPPPTGLEKAATVGLPPLVGYGIVFLFAAAVAALMAWVCFFQT